MRSMIAGLAMAGMLSACGGTAGSDGDGKADDSAKASETAKAAGPEIKALAGDHTFTVVLPKGITTAGMVYMAKTHCGERSDCTVWAYADPAKVPTSLPVTDEQRQAKVFEHVINRAQDNFERSLWRCEVYPQEDTSNCF